MAKKPPVEKASTLNHSAPSARLDLSVYCKDFEDWPRTWRGFDKDIPPGETLIGCFRPFIEYLVAIGLSRETVRKHIDNLWVLGGEIIRDLNETPSLRKRPVADLLFATVARGGPHCRHLDSLQQLRSFQSTCRKLHRFLSASSPRCHWE